MIDHAKEIIVKNEATRFEVRVQHLDCEDDAAKLEAGLL